MIGYASAIHFPVRFAPVEMTMVSSYLRMPASEVCIDCFCKNRTFPGVDLDGRLWSVAADALADWEWWLLGDVCPSPTILTALPNRLFTSRQSPQSQSTFPPLLRQSRGP